MARAIYILSWSVTIFAILSVVSHAFGEPWGLDAIHGSSMEPLITEEDVVIVVPYIPHLMRDPSIGDIIVFRNDKAGCMVMHRIHEVLSDERGFITKGDNVPVPDQELGMDLVRPDDIEGFVPQILGWPLMIPKIGILTHTFVKLAPNLRNYLSGFILIFLVISLVLDSRRIMGFRDGK